MNAFPEILVFGLCVSVSLKFCVYECVLWLHWFMFVYLYLCVHLSNNRYIKGRSQSGLNMFQVDGQNLLILVTSVPGKIWMMINLFYAIKMVLLYTVYAELTKMHKRRQITLQFLYLKKWKMETQKKTENKTKPAKYFLLGWGGKVGVSTKNAIVQ